MKQKIGSFFFVFFYAFVCALAVGCLTGALEIIALWPTTRGTSIKFLAPAAVFYSMVCSIIAFLLGLAFLLGRRSRSKPPAGEALARYYLSILLPIFIFVIAGGHINVQFLPSFIHPVSFVFDGFFLLLNIGFGYWFYRHGVVWGRKTVAGLPIVVKWVGIFGLLAAAVSAIVLSIPKKEKTAVRAISPPASAPNVLLITLDALRPDHMSVYGYERQTSPNLDRLASEGVLFTNAFSNSSWTKTSVATIFTSLYPSTHNVNEMGSGLSPILSTLPESFKSQGYATGVFSGNSFISPLFGFDQGVDYFYFKDVSIFKELMLGRIFFGLSRYSKFLLGAYRALGEMGFGPRKLTYAQGLNEAFLRWIESVRERPFFAYLHYIEPHEPYGGKPPFNTQFDPDYPPPYMTRLPKFDEFQPFAKAEPLPPRQLTNLIAQYDGGIAYVDFVLGELFRTLKEKGLYDRTIIVVTSDHGEEFYEHGGWGHGHSLFNVLLQVPLIMRYPPVLPSGTTVTHAARHIDLMPTLLDLSGISASDLMEGESLVPLAKGAENPVHPALVYSEVFHDRSYAHAVSDNGFKLIEAHSHEKEAWMLFDLANDPSEQNPFDVETHPMGPKLRELLSSTKDQARRTAVTPETVKLDKHTKEQLRALGYLQ